MTSDSNLMKSLMYMFTMMMADALEDEASAKDSKNIKIWVVVSRCWTAGLEGELVICSFFVKSMMCTCINSLPSVLSSLCFFSLWCGPLEPPWTKMEGINLTNCSGN